jgi:hypothetical protein
MNSSTVRVECPIVQTVTAAPYAAP